MGSIRGVIFDVDGTLVDSTTSTRGRGWTRSWSSGTRSPVLLALALAAAR